MPIHPRPSNYRTVDGCHITTVEHTTDVRRGQDVHRVGDRQRARGLALGLLLGMWLAPAVSIAAPLIVTASDDPLLAPGMVIDSAGVKLAAGKTLSVITASGRKATLKGPHDGAWAIPGFAAGVSDAERLAALSSLVATREGRTSTVGLVRKAPTKTRPATYAPEPRLISVAAAGVQCIAASGPYRLWRPADMPVSRLAMSTSGGEVIVDWGTAESADLPPGTAIADRTGITLRIDDRQPLTIELRGLPAELTEAIDRIVWMRSNQCEAQARLALDRLLAE